MVFCNKNKERTTMGITFTAQMIKALLSNRHPPGEWVLIYELSNGTGYNPNQRYVDAFALNCWPSKGFTRIAYEIKVSRSDFINELKRPEKRQWAMEVSHQFWFACAPGVAEKSEIPEGCGLLVASKNGKMLRAQVQAKHREAGQLAGNEIAAMLRRLDDREDRRNVYWKYAGRDLTEDDLKDIIANNRDWADQQEIRDKIQAGIDKAMQEIKSAAGDYVVAFKKAGIEAPKFLMKIHERGMFSTDWNVDEWFEQNVIPGPGLYKLQQAEKAIYEMERELLKAKKTINDLKNDTLGNLNDQQELAI